MGREHNARLEASPARNASWVAGRGIRRGCAGSRGRGDTRFDLWQDTLTAIGNFWPVGSGLGSFSRAFLPSERFAVIDETFPNRAHNDYLEFLLEAGLAGAAIVLAAAMLLAILARKAWQTSPDRRPTTVFALGILMVIGLHSLVDYPLRTMALACL